VSTAITVLVPSRRAIAIGLLAGLAHLIVAGGLVEWFGFSFGANPLSGYVAVGGAEYGLRRAMVARGE